MSIAGCEEKTALERRGFRPNFLVKAIVTEDPSLAIVSNSLTGSMLSQINLMSIEQAAKILETVAMRVEAEER